MPAWREPGPTGQVCRQLDQSPGTHARNPPQFIQIVNGPAAPAISERIKTLVKFTVNRLGGVHATFGRFAMTTPGIPTVAGFTLEPRDGTYDLSKSAGRKHYPIPTGRYDAVPEPHAKKGPWGLRLTGKVAGFEGILVHIGNYPWDTDGCILVGASHESRHRFSRSEMREHAADWKKYLELGFLEATEPEKAGVTEFIGSSGPTLEKMKRHYEAAVDFYGRENVVINVIVQGDPARTAARPARF